MKILFFFIKNTFQILRLKILIFFQYLNYNINDFKLIITLNKIYKKKNNNYKNDSIQPKKFIYLI